MKKVVSAVVSAALCLTSIAAFPVMAAGVPLDGIVLNEKVGESGKCGTDAYWSLEGGKMSITGSGALVNWAASTKVPWASLAQQINTVEIEEGITTIGSYAFLGCSNLRSVSIPDSMTSIGMGSFNSCSSLGSVDLPANVTVIGRDAFKNCSSLSTVTIRNRTCKIVGTSETISNSVVNDKASFSGTIIGVDSSWAQSFAKTYGYNFKLLDDQPVQTTTTSTTTTTTTTTTTSTTTSTTSKTTTTTAKPTTTSTTSTTVPITTTTPVPHSEDYMLGDVNGDKLIDSVDASKVLAEYAAVSSGKASKLSETAFKAADVDKNGMADSVDASKILAYYAYTSSEHGNVKSLSEFLEK